MLASTSATLNGSVTPRGAETSYEFEYGTDTSYGDVAPEPPASVGSGSEPVPTSADLSGLTPGTVYHYRLDAINATGTFKGQDQTLTTPGQ